MHELIMADYSVVSVSMAGVGQQGGLWIHVHNKSFLECAQIFSNPDKTQLMRIEYDETINDHFENYTNLVSLSVCDDFIKVGLERSE